MSTMKVRALFGLFEGNTEEPVFAGAMSEINYETLDEDEYESMIASFKGTCPEPTTDWREAWIEFDAPDLSTPPIAASVTPAKEES